MSENNTFDVNDKFPVTSEIGTKEYWDNIYHKEHHNFKENEIIAEGWFGNLVKSKIIKFVNKCALERGASVLDVGCGNGDLLITLGKYKRFDLVGLDYSENAIEFCKDQFLKTIDDGPKITFLVKDILQEIHEEKKYRIIIDKGTFDAISQNPIYSDSVQKLEMSKIYFSNINKLLEDSGYFLIASCNFTKTELEDLSCEYFVEYENLSNSGIEFGGKTGTTTTIIAFAKRKFHLEES